MAMDASQVQQLRESLRGRVLEPSSGDEWCTAVKQTWNVIFHSQVPALVALPHCTSDIVACVQFARRHGLKVSVLGGGHNWAGQSVASGSLQINLSEMRACIVNPLERTVTAQGGCTLGDIDRETAQHGLAMTLGTWADTGCGLVLGGGYGYMCRKAGPACDFVLEAELVLPDGSVKTVNQQTDSELLWGVRGCAASFGVVSSFKCRLVEAPQCRWIFASLPLEQLHSAIELGKRVHDDTAHPEIAFQMLAMNSPAGQACVLLFVTSTGGAEADLKQYHQQIDAMQPLVNQFATGTYLDLQNMLPTVTPFPPSIRARSSSGFVAKLDNAEVSTIEGALKAAMAIHPASALLLELFDCSSRDPAEAAKSCFPTPPASWNITGACFYMSPDEDEKAAEAIKTFKDTVSPLFVGSYTNYVDLGEAGNRAQRLYGPNVDRLVQLKRKYDPQLLLKGNLPFAFWESQLS